MLDGRDRPLVRQRDPDAQLVDATDDEQRVVRVARADERRPAGERGEVEHAVEARVQAVVERARDAQDGRVERRVERDEREDDRAQLGDV